LTVRAIYRTSFLLCLVSSHVAAWLASRYRDMTRAAQELGLIVVPVQLLLLVAWWPARAVSVGTLAVCRHLAAQA
jgi:hypothetical protein